MEQYKIVYVDFSPTIGSEIDKIRPAVIVSPNEMNKYLKTVVVCPITHTDKNANKNYPTRIAIKQGKIDGFICIDQIRTVSKIRVQDSSKYDHLNPLQITILKAKIKETFVD